MSNTRKDETERLAEVFRALSNPNRLRIFLRLITCCPPGTVHSIEPGTGSYVGDLGKELEIVPSTVSHHIKELQRAGLIRMKRAGQRIECWVDAEALKELAKFFSR
jgi:ArsR family transcriptional regulator, arsenate/arsenite/antimonite-responsive transcriptional repressor